jgi:hypothetical protein
MNCSERDQLDKAVGQPTLEWTALDQTPLPDVSIPGGLNQAEDLTRRESAREILNRATDSIPGALPNASLLELISATLFRCGRNRAHT